MTLHYIKVAFRNLWKYKAQNIIIGLAVGLLCFSVCMYCSRFVESTNHCFDNYSRIAELNFYNEQTGDYFSGTQVALSEELRTWAMGEVEAISCMAYPRERSFLVELSSDKSLPYDLEIMEVEIIPHHRCYRLPCFRQLGTRPVHIVALIGSAFRLIENPDCGDDIIGDF